MAYGFRTPEYCMGQKGWMLYCGDGVPMNTQVGC